MRWGVDLMPSAELVSRRVPWRAALLGLVGPGLGQLYGGRPLRAIVVHLLSGGIALTCISGFFIPFRPWNIIVPLAGPLLVWLLALGDAVRCARMAAPDYRLRPYNRWYVYLLLMVLVGLEQGAIGSFLHARFAGVKNVTGSMFPTVVAGDYLFVNKRAYIDQTPQRGDVVYFRYPPNPSVTFVKRVIAVGGDVVRIEHKKVYLNGQPLLEPYAQFQSPADNIPLRDDFPPGGSVLETLPAAWGLDPAWKREIPGFARDDGLHIPRDFVFVLGDNRDNSLDSRFWGFLPRSNVLGRAGVIYFSWDAEAHHLRWDRLGEILK
jgi:signal peptidase I